MRHECYSGRVAMILRAFIGRLTRDGRLGAICLSGALLLIVGACARPNGDVAKGRQLFDSTCDVCHYANSTIARAGPGLAGLYKKKTMVNGIPVNDKNMDRWIRDGSHLMPGYKDKLSQKQMQDLIAYLRTL
jgi:mono/diheme cytochrome c family protein